MLFRSGGEVLKTTYETKEQDGRLYLLLEENSLRYTKDSEPYATVRECYFEGDCLVISEFFPISGESTDQYKRTNNSRYGDADILDIKNIPDLLGVWSCGSAFLKITTDRIFLSYEKGKFSKKNALPMVILRTRYNGEVRIAHADPSKDGIFYYIRMVYSPGQICATVPVCDAPSVTEVFKKIKD